MKQFWLWLVARFFKNWGHVSGPIYRSGQMGRFRLPFFVKRYKIETIIALNMDGSNNEERFEIEYCIQHGIRHIKYNWSAGENNCPEQLNHVITVMEHSYNNNIPLLIHCAGGRDRTGGTIGVWAGLYQHITKEYWMEMCCRHRIPAEGWLKEAFRSFKHGSDK